MKLFCPGPVNVLKKIKNIDINEISHRTNNFHLLYNNCTNITKSLFNVNNDKFTPLFITGSGTITVESIIYSYLKNKNILILQNGSFSEKWEKLFETYNSNYFTLNFEWGNSFDYEKITSFLNKNIIIDGIFFVHHETSTTQINDLNKLNDIAIKYKIKLYIDGVSSVGIYNINLKKLSSIDSIGFSSNKGIGIYPGLAVIMVKTNLFSTMENKLSYLNLKTYYEFSLKSETPFTPCYQNFEHYYISVSDIVSNLQSRYLHYENLMDYFIKELNKIGIKPYLEKQQCIWVINIKCNKPDYLYDELFKNDIIVYKCKGKLKKECVQIAILNKTKTDIQFLISKIKCILN